MVKAGGKILALTGGIACGKSTVCEFFRGWGAEIWDADEASHRLTGPGGALAEAVVARFGEGVRSADGGVDRKALGAVVFADAEALGALNRLVHPAVRAAGREWAAGVRERGGRGVAAVPLLFECGWEGGGEWDEVASVCARRETVLGRLEGRGFAGEEAAARIDSQWPVEEKAARCKWVIWNDGGLEALEAECRRVWEGVFLGGGGRDGRLKGA